MISNSSNLNGTIPRPYIVVEPGADPSYITDSEIAYLGRHFW